MDSLSAVGLPGTRFSTEVSPVLRSLGQAVAGVQCCRVVWLYVAKLCWEAVMVALGVGVAFLLM